MPSISVKSIKRIGILLVLLGAGGALYFALVMGRFTAPDPGNVWPLSPKRFMEELLLSCILLVVFGIGVWRLRPWARWCAFFWFPVFAINGLVVEWWWYHAISSESKVLSLLMALLSMVSLYRRLFGEEATRIFHGASAQQDAMIRKEEQRRARIESYKHKRSDPPANSG